MGTGQRNAEVLRVHHHKISKELLNLQQLQDLSKSAMWVAM